jgi:hypothetical protein
MPASACGGSSWASTSDGISGSSELVDSIIWAIRSGGAFCGTKHSSRYRPCSKVTVCSAVSPGSAKA